MAQAAFPDRAFSKSGGCSWLRPAIRRCTPPSLGFISDRRAHLGLDIHGFLSRSAITYLIRRDSGRILNLSSEVSCEAKRDYT